MLPPFLPIPYQKGANFVNMHDKSCDVYLSSWPMAWGATKELIVSVHEHIHCFFLKNGTSVEEKCLPLPENFIALCVYCTDEYIFIGGKGGKQKILCIRIHDCVRMEVEHPNVLLKYRKSIDDFFIRDRLLYAIDNHIYPKYLLEYKLEGDIWCCIQKHKLKSHAPEERVKGGLLWAQRLVLLSRSAHRAGSSTYLSFYSGVSFERYLCWHKTIASTGVTDIYKMRIYKNKLLLVTNIGVASLSKDGKEEDLTILFAQKNLIDVYPREDSEWIGIISRFGKITKVLL